jgi:hypothetical protein
LWSRYGSVVKWWNEKINENKRSQVRSQPGQRLKKDEIIYIRWANPLYIYFAETKTSRIHSTGTPKIHRGNVRIPRPVLP